MFASTAPLPLLALNKAHVAVKYCIAKEELTNYLTKALPVDDFLVVRLRAPNKPFYSSAPEDVWATLITIGRNRAGGRSELTKKSRT